MTGPSYTPDTLHATWAAILTDHITPNTGVTDTLLSTTDGILIKTGDHHGSRQLAADLSLTHVAGTDRWIGFRDHVLIAVQYTPTATIRPLRRGAA